jgi:hypothetical protein
MLRSLDGDRHERRMMSFSIEPCVGALPTHFGMTPGDIEPLLGPPMDVVADSFGNKCEPREHFWLGFSADDNTLM